MSLQNSQYPAEDAEPVSPEQSGTQGWGSTYPRVLPPRPTLPRRRHRPPVSFDGEGVELDGLAAVRAGKFGAQAAGGISDQVRQWVQPKA
jgi:hypothetical protein